MVVVIAVLAAVTIVAFNGVQQRAQSAVLQSNLSSAAKYMKNQLALSGVYPTSPSSLPGADTTTYELTANNTSTPKTYCITATKSGSSYKISHTDGSPSEGMCAGHTGSGPVIITNLALNPSFEVDNSGWSSTRADTAVVADAGQTGGNVLRVTVNSVGYFPRVYINNSLASPISSGNTYRISAWVKSSTPVVLLAQPLTSSYANAGSSATQTFSSVSDWTYISMTVDASDSGAAFMTVWIGFANNSPIGTTMDIDSVMLTEGAALHNYGDGSSPGWSWSGTPHSSVSTGPAI